MKPLRLDYSIVTINRPANYLDDLVAHLPEEQPKRVFVGSPDTSYLHNLKAKPSFQIYTPAVDEWEVVKRHSVYQKATWNYWRALAHIPESVDRDGVLVLEDDILPARGWLDYLRNVILALRDDEGPDYILALYSSRRHPLIQKSKLYTIYPAYLFAGTQAVFFPERIRREFAIFLKKYGVDPNEAPYDMLLAEYAVRSAVNLFLTVPVLVQHIGKVGTGLGDFHQAPDFHPDLTHALPTP